MAVNCCVVPTAIEGLAGITAMETSTGAVTVSVVEPLTDPKVATIVVLPWETLLANPAALIMATLAEVELHTTEAVRFCMLPSL